MTKRDTSPTREGRRPGSFPAAGLALPVVAPRVYSPSVPSRASFPSRAPYTRTTRRPGPHELGAPADAHRRSHVHPALGPEVPARPHSPRGPPAPLRGGGEGPERRQPPDRAVPRRDRSREDPR